MIGVVGITTKEGEKKFVEALGISLMDVETKDKDGNVEYKGVKIVVISENETIERLIETNNRELKKVIGDKIGTAIKYYKLIDIDGILEEVQYYL